MLSTTPSMYAKGGLWQPFLWHTVPVKIKHTNLHRRIQGGVKGAHAPRGSKTKTVKSACFWLIASFSTP